MTRPPPDRATTQIDTPIPNVKVTVEELITLLGRYRAVCAAAQREFRGGNAVQSELLRKMHQLGTILEDVIPKVMP